MNPYRIESPSLISLSGGRTSAFLLKQILNAFNGALPAGVFVAFANTGKERPQTLDFVHEIEMRWTVPVAWLEYDRVQDDAGEWSHTYRVVDYATAARNGEPFEKLIEAKSYLPTPVTRFCTSELKIRVMKKYMRSLGHEQWDVALGLRGDEPARVHRASLSCARERYRNVAPMFRAGHDLRDVMMFWMNQPFDLKLEQHEGNCDLCFLKGAAKIERIIVDRPDLVDWWARMEQKTASTFRCDRPKYANQLKIIQEQGRFDFDSEEFTVCNCTD